MCNADEMSGRFPNLFCSLVFARKTVFSYDIAPQNLHLMKITGSVFSLPNNQTTKRRQIGLWLCLFCFCGIFSPLSAQIEDDEIPETLRQLIEAIIEEGGGDNDDFAFNDLAEKFRIYERRPLNLNRATAEELEDFLLFNDIQINGLISYRARFGDLLASEELQAVPGFDLPTIRAVLPYITVKGDVDDYNVKAKELLLNGDNEFFISSRRITEPQRGYIEGEFADPYLGSPYRIYTRFQRRYEDRLSVGFTAEKDAGEEFFTGSNPQGFDFYSAHLFLNKYSRFLKSLALGDYQIGLGQGLISRAGFGYGKSVEVMDIRRTGRTLNAQRSANEFDFFRGAGATLGLGEQTEFTAFYSLRRRDANLLRPDTAQIESPDDLLGFSSFQASGLHRYRAEIEDENAVRVQTMGGSFKQKFGTGHVALNAINHSFDQDFSRNLQIYNQFEFNSSSLLNVSLDYSYIWRNFNFFGETAWSDNNSIATLNGLLIGLDRRVDFAVLHRYYPRDFHSLNARPFGETTATGGRNETGLYLGLEVRPSNQWKIQAYYDTWQHPWLRSNIDAPSTGNETFVQLTFTKKRKLNIYLRGRLENKNRNVRSLNDNRIYDQQRATLRLHIGNKISKTLELRNRFEISRYRLDNPAFDVPLISINLLDGESVTSDVPGLQTNGFMLYQDIIYKPINFPISFTARYALFDTDDYNSRIYAYENDLLYSFTVPAYYYRGSRAYLNVRWRGIRNLTLEGRIAQTYLAGRRANVDFVGFGNGREEIDGRTRTEVKVQMKIKF